MRRPWTALAVAGALAAALAACASGLDAASPGRDRSPAALSSTAGDGSVGGPASEAGGRGAEGPGARGAQQQPTPAAPVAPIVPVAPAVLLAVGDVAWCGPDENDTAALAASLEGTIAILGDLVYDAGTAQEIARCWEPGWGTMRDRIRPAIGNHDAVTESARPLFDWFGGTLSGRPAAADGAAVGAWPDGWYSYDLGAWHVVVLNSNCRAAGGCGPDSRQVDWLRADLAEHPDQHLLAYWHHPRFSTGDHGGDTTVQPFHDVLAEHGVDLVLNGHEHSYERRRLPLGSPDAGPSPGPARQFIVGTGGAVLRPFRSEADADSEARQSTAHGILRLELGPCGYAWQFIEAPDDLESNPDAPTPVLDEGSASGTC